MYIECPSLQHIGDWHVDVSLLLPVVVLRPLDDHQVRRKVDPPRHGGRRYQDLEMVYVRDLPRLRAGCVKLLYCLCSLSAAMIFSFPQSKTDLYLLVDEQLLDGPPVTLREAGVVHPDAEGQRQP